MDLRAMTLPTCTKNAMLRLLADIEVAESVQAVRMTGNRAEGFVLGLETAQAFKSDVTEALYIGFESAVTVRMKALLDGLS